MSDITSNLCRLCLKESFTLHNIYSSRTKSGDLVYRVLNYVYDLEITADDGLLTHICAPCMWKMLEFEGYKINVNFARVEIVKLLSKIRPGSTGGCGSRESDERPIGSDSSQAVLPREDIKPRQEEGELSNIVDGEQSPGSSELKNIVSLEAFEEAAGNSFDGESSSICTTQVNSVEIKDTNKAINENDLRDVVPEEKSRSSELSKSILNVRKSGRSPLNPTCSKRKRVFICDICKKVYTSKQNLGFHVQAHCDERRFGCNICDKTFMSSNVRYVHELRHLRGKMSFGKSEKGSKKKLYSCAICAKNFCYKSGLYAHSNMHSDKYKCNSCGKSCGNNTDLRIHSRIHTNEKPFKCELCFKCFSAKSNLNNHLLTHSSKRPYSCDICDKRFKSKRDRNQHALLHLRKK